MLTESINVEVFRLNGIDLWEMEELVLSSISLTILLRDIYTSTKLVA